MKQPTREEKKNGIETDEGIIYPTHCELGKVYSPEECEKLGILT